MLLVKIHRILVLILWVKIVTFPVQCFKFKRQDNKKTWLVDSVSVHHVPEQQVEYIPEHEYKYQHHDELLGHVPYVKKVYSYNMKDYNYKKPKNKARIVIRSALLIGAGATLLKSLTYGSSSEVVTTTESPSTITSTSGTTTSASTTTTSSTTASSTSTSSTTTSTTTTSTTPSTTTTSTTTTSTTTPSTTTTSTSTTSTTTTTPKPLVTCDRTTSVTATSVGDMGVFEFLKEKTPGNLKICETVTAPPGTKIQVVCNLVDLIGGGTSSNHYLKLQETNSNGAVIANPPVVGTTYSSSSNILYFEAAVTSADSFSCKWTVVAAFIRFYSYVWKPPFTWLLPDYIVDRFL